MGIVYPVLNPKHRKDNNMAQGIYKIGEVIDVSYQATKATSGLTDVNMEIYDQTRAKDIGNFPDVTMTEIGSTGRYYGSLTPDAEGIWTIMIDSATKSGKIVKTFAITAHNIDSIGDAVAALNNLSAAAVNAEVDTALADYDAPTKAELDSGLAGLNDVSSAEVNTQVDTALADYDGPTKAELDASELAIRGADSDTLETLSDQLDGIEGPPMLG